MNDLGSQWDYDVLGVYNSDRPGQLSNYFRFLEENINHIPGDIAEFGVYRGASILATGLLLKKLGSNKKIYGFDSFGGFPSYHSNDDLSLFDSLFEQNRISKEHWKSVKKNIHFRQTLTKQHIDAKNISSSGDFSDNSLPLLKAKIELLALDNIVLIEGDFAETATAVNDRPLMAALVDCDLFGGYRDCLPFIWRNLSLGGYIYLDEYFSLKFPGAKIATDHFFESRRDKPQQHKHTAGDFERWFVRKIYGDLP